MTHKNHDWLRVLAFIIPYIIISDVFQYVGSLIAEVNITDSKAEKSSLQQLIIQVFNLLGTFTVVWIFMKYVDKEKFVKLGFATKGRFKEFNAGLLVGLIVMATSYLLLLALGQLYFKKVIVSINDILISVLLFAIVAIVEEVLLRGYVLRNFMQSFNKYIALVLSSLLFAVMHLANPNMDWFSFLNLFLAGILLGLSYIYTKNLWFPIALHLSWNLFQSLFGFNVSGQDFYSLIEFEITDKNLLNGGDFGFEGSIFSVVFQVMIIGLIWVYYHRKSVKAERIN